MKTLMTVFAKTALFVMTLLLPLQSWAEAIGKVILTQGKPMVERGEELTRLKRNDALFEQDKLITQAGSKLMFRLQDKTKISLAENTEFELSQYRFDQVAETSDVRFKMVKGAFRTLSGLIGKQANPMLEIETPMATIGIRGTEFWGGFIFSDALDVTMLSGKGIYIENEFGRVDINEAGLGTTVQPGQAPGEVKPWSDEKRAKAAEATAVDDDSDSNGASPSSSNSSRSNNSGYGY